jgi:hypothetical protein
MKSAVQQATSNITLATIERCVEGTISEDSYWSFKKADMVLADQLTASHIFALIHGITEEAAMEATKLAFWGYYETTS